MSRIAPVATVTGMLVAVINQVFANVFVELGLAQPGPIVAVTSAASFAALTIVIGATTLIFHNLNLN